MEEPVERLERRLGVPDAVVIGLGSMLGARVFVVFGPATAAAGSGFGLLAVGALGYTARWLGRQSGDADGSR